MKKAKRNPKGDLGLPTLTDKERGILRKAAFKVVKSIMARERSSLKRRLLFYAADREMMFEAVLARAKLSDRVVFARH